MSFDVRPYFKENPKESQVVEGGNNWNDNCVPTSLINCLLMLGYPDVLEPQDITDAVYGPNYHGGEDFAPPLQYIYSRTDLYPNLPQYQILNEKESDFIASAIRYGYMGYPQVGGFWCDVNAHITPFVNQFSHASLIVAYDDATDKWTIYNIWTGYEQIFSTDELLNAYTAGPWHVVFEKSVFPQPILKGKGQRPVNVVVIDPGDATTAQPFSISSPIFTTGRKTNFNFTVNGDKAEIELFAWSPTDGKVVGHYGPKEISGNQPNVRGPEIIAGDGSLLGLPNDYGPYTLGIIINGNHPVVAAFHDE